MTGIFCPVVACRIGCMVGRVCVCARIARTRICQSAACGYCVCMQCTPGCAVCLLSMCERVMPECAQSCGARYLHIVSQTCARVYILQLRSLPKLCLKAPFSPEGICAGLRCLYELLLRNCWVFFIFLCLGYFGIALQNCSGAGCSAPNSA